MLAQYTTRYPAVARTVTTGNSADLVAQVLYQDLHGAFVRGPVSQPGLRAEPVFWEHSLLVTGQATQSLADLRQTEVKAFVLAQGCSCREVLTGILDRAAIRHQVLAVDSFDAIRTLVQANVGVTLLPREFLATLWKGAAVAVHELPPGSASVETTFITRSDQPASSALQAFLSLSRTVSNIEV